MLEQDQSVQPELIASTLSWWEEAGVGALVEDVPMGWLSKAAPAVITKPTSAAAPAAAARPVPLDSASVAPPKSVPEFVDWLTQIWTAQEAGPLSQRLSPTGNPASALMVLIDMPEPGDVQAGQLLSGEAGALFDKMLEAIKHTRQTIWLGSLSPARPPGGQIGQDTIAQLLAVARHHIDLIGPKRLWLMGQTVSRALIGADAMPGTGCLRKINHEGRIVDAVASFSPRFLLQQPKRKAAAWADMQALVEGI